MYYETKINTGFRERLRLTANLEVKSLDEKGRFTGYASIFNVVDSQNDILLRGAFTETLQGRIKDIKLLWQHQQDEPIGVFKKIFEDKKGLFVEGELLLDVARAREAYALLKEGAIGGLSIGYTPVKYRRNEKTSIRLIAKVDLWEVSLVTFPANALAKVTVVKTGVCPHLNPLPQREGISSPMQFIALSEVVSRASAVFQK